MLPIVTDARRFLASLIPSKNVIREKTRLLLGFLPCDWQVETVQALLSGQNVITVAPTGFGKTATFWMPFPFEPINSVCIIVTPLTSLGKQQMEEVQHMNLKCFFITNSNITNMKYTVRRQSHDTAHTSPVTVISQCSLRSLSRMSPTLESLLYPPKTRSLSDLLTSGKHIVKRNVVCEW